MRPGSSAKSAVRRGGLVQRMYRVRTWAFSALLLGALSLAAACGGGDDGLLIGTVSGNVTVR